MSLGKNCFTYTPCFLCSLPDCRKQCTGLKAAVSWLSMIVFTFLRVPGSWKLVISDPNSTINPPYIVFIATQPFSNSLAPVSACLGLNSQDGLVCRCYQFPTKFRFPQIHDKSPEGREIHCCHGSSRDCSGSAPNKSCLTNLPSCLLGLS